MNITMLTESLGNGGAERQLCHLAITLKQRGHSVVVTTYSPGEFYLPLLQSKGIDHICLGGSGTRQWLVRIRQFLRSRDHDVVVAFQGTCSLYAELAALPSRDWGLIVSERLAFPDRSWSHKIRKQVHFLADCVTTNSHTNRLLLERLCPGLKSRLVTIYNGVDLDLFRPLQGVHHEAKSIRVLVVARFARQKNPLGTIQALSLLLKNDNSKRITIEWYANVNEDKNLFEEAMNLINRDKLAEHFTLLPPTNDIIARYHQSDVLLLPSFYEGLPNSVCEAMACGKPILMSAVCDAGNLVLPGINGFLFDPYCPESIVESLRTFADLTRDERKVMGENSRGMAEKYFDLNLITDKYEKIILSSIRGEKPPIEHWLPNVPATATLSLQ